MASSNALSGAHAPLRPKQDEQIGEILKETRQSWPSKEATVQVVVVEEDVRTHKGEVEAIILPAQAPTQAASAVPKVNAKSASKKPGASGPLAFHIHWVWSGSHWWLDGRQSLAVVGLP